MTTTAPQTIAIATAAEVRDNTGAAPAEEPTASTTVGPWEHDANASSDAVREDDAGALRDAAEGGVAGGAMGTPNGGLDAVPEEGAAVEIQQKEPPPMAGPEAPHWPPGSDGVVKWPANPTMPDPHSGAAVRCKLDPGLKAPQARGPGEKESASGSNKKVTT